MTTYSLLLEKKIERCVKGFAKEASRELSRKKPEGSCESISHIVHLLWNAQVQHNSLTHLELTPLYANAVVAVRDKAVELAPGFLEGSSYHLKHPEGAQRLFRRGALVLAKLSWAYANAPDSKAGQERSNFEDAIKAEFYRVVRAG